jgi:hypothetical protein
MKLCPDYWDIIDGLAREGAIFCTEEVAHELEKTDDDLHAWAKAHPHLFREITPAVMDNIRSVLAQFPRLVDTIKDRSMADPWVIAHAMAEKATVVTKEPLTKGSKTRIRIPDVCDAMGVLWMDDHRFAAAVGLKFSARR